MGNHVRDYEKLLSTAGFEMVKELNVDFTIFLGPLCNANFNWFFGLINDCNSIEILRLSGLTFPFFGKSSGDMASIKEKFKNLKKCRISFQQDFEQYFEYLSSGYADLSWKQYAAELAIPQDELYMDTLAEDLDKTFAGTSTEFKFIVPNKRRRNKKTKEVAFFQIIKMPFQNSVT